MQQTSLRAFILLFFVVLMGGLVRELSLKPRVIEVEADESPVVIDYAPSLDNASWTLASKMAQAEKALETVKLRVGSKNIVYQEDRVSNDESGLTLTKITAEEPEKEIALAVMNKINGDIKVIKIIKRGDEIISPPDFPIELVERSNGIRWNKWNTQYKLPENYIVLKNSYPEVTSSIKKIVRDKKGRKTAIYENKIDQFIYSPYSEDLHTQELVQAGRQQIKLTVQQAFNELRQQGVKSRAFPGKLIADVAALRPEFFQLLPIIEQTDMTEFILDPKRTSERVLVIIGANPNTAFARTGSFAGALGWVQYTPGTYAKIRNIYHSAGLIKDFATGAANHHNSIMASILLYDYNLAGLISHYGQSIADDSRLEEYLAAEYNGGSTRITSSLNATLADRGVEWGINLKNETRGYIVKLRKLREINLIESVGEISKFKNS